jgi:hypothetical protein
MAATLEERLAEQRRVWVPLGDDGRRRVRFSRPLATELHLLAAGLTVDTVCRYVDGWDGFTDADILGAAVGSSDTPADFTPTLFAAWVRDEMDVLKTLAEAIAESVRQLVERRELVGKN